MNKKEYINKLYEFTDRKNTTIYNYYKKLAILCRKHKEFNIIGFEAGNPFLTPEDYKKLLDSSDELMPEFFARAMVKVVQCNDLIFAEEERLAKEEAEKKANSEKEESKESLSLCIIKDLIDKEYEKLEEKENKEEVKEEKTSEPKELIIPGPKSLMVIQPKCTDLVPVQKVQKKEEPKKGLLSREAIKNIIDKGFLKHDRREDRLSNEVLEQYLKMKDNTPKELAPVEREEAPVVEEKQEEIKAPVNKKENDKASRAAKKASMLDKLLNRSNSKDKVATVLERLTKGTSEEAPVADEKTEVKAEALPAREQLLALPAHEEPVVKSTELVPAAPQILARTDIMDSINAAMDNIVEEQSLAVIEQPKKKRAFNITSINTAIIEKLKGLALIKESKTGRANLFYHDPKLRELKGRTKVDGIKADSGYYVNYQEYIFKMIAHTMNKYPNANELRFVNQDGEEKSISEVVEEVFKTLREAGSIRFGNEYANAKINKYSDLKGIKPGYGLFANEKLKKGIYVRRDILSSEFKKYKLRFVMQRDEEEVTYKKTK